MVALAGAPARAQDQQPLRLGDSPEAQQVTQIKQAVTGFEQVVANAVILGGRLVQTEVRQYIPDVKLQLAGEPSVSGSPVDEIGYFFDVQCPDILETQLVMLDLYRNRPELIRQMAGTRAATLPADFNAGQVYGDKVRESLMDAMVDFSAPLPLDDAEWLVVVARVPSGAPRQLLDDSRKLILRISGADLRLYRVGTLSRDEVKARILERRF